MVIKVNTIFDGIARQYLENNPLDNYEKTRDQLFIRPLPASRVKHETDVYHQVGDIALVLYVKVGEEKDAFFSARIPENVMAKWGCPLREVLDTAMHNTFLMNPPRIYFLEKMMMDHDYRGETFLEPDTTIRMEHTIMGNCVSTASRINGAVAPFLPGVASRLGELLGEDYYLAFTSIHEVMIHKESLVAPEDLEVILRETIDETTRADEILSYKIYHYCREQDRIEAVGA